MDELIPRFDMTRDPIPTRWFLRPLTYLLSLPDTLLHRTRIHRDGVEGLKPPYVLLCNHNAFLDFKVATRAIFPKRANYVVAIDGFIGREWLLRNVGCICKRKFTSDIRLVKQLIKVIRNKDIAVIYPEARYSLCGTTAVLPASLGKLCKLLKDWRFPVTGTAAFTQAQVTAGGVSGRSLRGDLSSRIVPELYFCGELIDIDGDCGGYNLMWAWCSGDHAGRCACGAVPKKRQTR
jgi:hypothetical protein